MRESLKENIPKVLIAYFVGFVYFDTADKFRAGDLWMFGGLILIPALIIIYLVKSSLKVKLLYAIVAPLLLFFMAVLVLLISFAGFSQG